MPPATPTTTDNAEGYIDSSSADVSLGDKLLHVDSPTGKHGNRLSISRLLEIAWQRKDFLFSVCVAFGIVALQLGQGVLLARLLGPKGRGEYGTAMLMVQMLLYIGLLGGLEIVCKYANRKNIDLDALRRSAFWLGVTTGTITVAVAIIASMLALPADKKYLMPLAILAAISMFGQQIMLMMTAVDRGAGQFTAYNLKRIGAAAAFPVLLVVSFLFVEVTVPLACWLFVIASLISMTMCVYPVKKPFTGIRVESTRQLLLESKPYGLSMLATDLFERLDIWLVVWLVSSVEKVGWYTAMVPVVYTLTIIPNTLGMFLFNFGADEDRQLTTNSVHKILASSIGVQFLVTAVFMVLIGPVVRFVYGEDFAPAVQYALWLAPASAMKGILQGLDNFLKGRGRPIAAVGCRFVAAIAMLLISFLLFQRLEVFAIAIACLVGQIICLVWVSYLMYREVPRRRAEVSA